MIPQNENRPADWVPATVDIDAGITDQMRNFFSDYQHITKRFYELNRNLERLKAIDNDRHLQLYRFTINKIIEGCVPQKTPGGRG
jgi:hypothetical protein